MTASQCEATDFSNFVILKIAGESVSVMAGNTHCQSQLLKWYDADSNVSERSQMIPSLISSGPPVFPDATFDSTPSPIPLATVIIISRLCNL
jgi:hypothetical protein